MTTQPTNGGRVLSKESPISLGLTVMLGVGLVGAAGWGWSLGADIKVAVSQLTSMDGRLQRIETQQREDSKVLHANASMTEGTRQRVESIEKRIDRIEQQVRDLQNHKGK